MTLISAIAVITAVHCLHFGLRVKKTESGDLTEVTMAGSNSHSKVVIRKTL